MNIPHLGLTRRKRWAGPVDPRNFLRVLEAAAKAGVEGVDAHTLRHSAAVAWLEAGVVDKRSSTGGTGPGEGGDTEVVI